MDTELAFTSALDQARLLRDGKVSSRELVEGYLARIDRLDGQLGAFLTVADDLARAWADEADMRRGEDGSPPFLGVPVSIKDLHDTAGIRTTYGTASWNERVPDEDDHVVRRIKRAGFVVIGKTNTPEFGKSAVTEPEAYHPARNPWDPQRSPGGSSGGAAAALAAGLCPIAQASDGGGSTRMPAACCGVYGLKPSRGRVSDAPGFPAVTSHPGPLARTVADAAAFLDVIAGYETGDMFTAPPAIRPYLDEATTEPGRLRIAFTTAPPVEGTEVDPLHVDAVGEAATLLADLGHDVREQAPPWTLGVVHAGIALRYAALIARDDLPDLETLDELTRLFVIGGQNLSARDYLIALRDLQHAVRGVIAFFDEVDVLLTPAIGIRPPFVGEFRDIFSKPGGTARLAAMASFTMPFNNTGQPAAALPFGIGPDALPIAIQLVTRPWDEATLFRLSAQIERARPWAHLRPPVS